jgi:hypothetical protein
MSKRSNNNNNNNINSNNTKNNDNNTTKRIKLNSNNKQNKLLLQEEDEQQQQQPAIDQIQAEVDVLKRLIYKNTNQHRRAKYFQGLQMLQSSTEKAIREYYNSEKAKKEFFIQVKNIDTIQEAKDSQHHLSQQLMDCALSIQLWNKVRQRGFHVSKKLAILISQRFFLNFAVVSISMASHCVIIANQILCETLDIFASMIGSWLHKLRSLAGKTTTGECTTTTSPNNKKQKFVHHHNNNKKKNQTILINKSLNSCIHFASQSVCNARSIIPLDAEPLQDVKQQMDDIITMGGKLENSTIINAKHTSSAEDHDDNDLGISIDR